MAPIETRHVPVLLDRVLDVLQPRPGQVVVDCTVGLGGHAAALLKAISPGGRLIGFDFDPQNLKIATAALQAISDRFVLHHSNFAAISKIVMAEEDPHVDSILADLGVASPQIDDPSRGFSYRAPGPLDMRMNPGRSESAAQLLARLSEDEIRDALFDLGDEEDAPRIARLIVRRRAERPILTTDDLTAIVCEARDFTLRRAAGAKLHPAARTFQALRILVNREMQNLERLLDDAPRFLRRPGGRIAIISFHSGEDRRVKQSFRELLRANVYSDVSPEPIIATADEQRVNSRSRSAKLRWAQRGSSTLA
jgi:16S rRNA (cytosine1402-N4)-methyltransferase